MTVSAPLTSAWLTVKQAAAVVQCSPALIYLNIKQGRLRASRLGYRKDLRIREDWLEAWIVSLSTPHDIAPPETPVGPLAFTRHGRKRTK